MAQVDLKRFQGFDVEAVMELPGYRKHRVDPEGKSKEWLIVDGVSQANLDAAMANYNHANRLARIAKEEARSNLGATNEQMFDLLEEVIEKSPGLRAKLSARHKNILTQRENLRAQING